MSGGVLLYVDAKSIERNEVYEAFSQPDRLNYGDQILFVETQGTVTELKSY